MSNENKEYEDADDSEEEECEKDEPDESEEENGDGREEEGAEDVDEEFDIDDSTPYFLGWRPSRKEYYDAEVVQSIKNLSSEFEKLSSEVGDEEIEPSELSDRLEVIAYCFGDLGRQYQIAHGVDRRARLARDPLDIDSYGD